MLIKTIEALRRLHRAAGKAVRRAVVRAPLVAALLGAASLSHAASSAFLNINVTYQGISSVSDLSAATASSTGTINLSWTEPYHSFGTPPFTYDVRVSTVGQIASDLVFSTSSLLSAFSPSVPPAPGSGGGAAAFGVSGLTGGVTYYFAIREQDNSGLHGVWMRSLVPARNVNNFAVPFSTTPAPTGAAIRAVSTGTVSLAWNVVPSATSYAVIASTLAANPPTQVAASSITASSTATVSGLFPNTTYFLFVSACGIGCSPYAAPGATVTLAMPAVSLTTAAATANSISLSWSPNGNSSGTTYLIEVSTDGVGYSTAPPVSTTGTVVGGLMSATTYYFQVVAQNFAGVSAAPSNVLTAVTGVQFGPASGSVTAVSSGTISAAWTAAAGATDYVLVAAASPAVPPQAIAASTVAYSTAASVSGLAPNTSYYLFVSACGAGCSAYTALGSTYTLAAPASSLIATAQSSGTVALTWNSAGNPAGTTYVIETSTDGVSFSSSAVTTATSGQVSGLRAATSYYFEIVAVSSPGIAAAPSNIAAVATPAGVTLPPAGGSIVAVTSTTIAATWAVSAGATDYVLIASSASPLIAASSTTVGSTATLSGLAPNTTYFLSVSACGAGCSAYASIGSTITMAAPAVALSSTSLSSSTAGLAWSPNGNPSGTLYTVLLSTDGTAYFAVLNTAAVFAQTSGLTGGVTYFFEVVAVNAAGTPAAASNVLRVVTPVLAPAAPTGVTATGGLLSVSVAWTPLPARKQGAGLGVYRVLRSLNANYGYAEIAQTSGTSYLDKPLAVGVTYFYEIVARDVAGVDGPVSAPASATVFSLPPMEPLGVSAAASSTTVKISWSPTSRFFDGTPFVSTGAPTPDELSGYTVYRATDICTPNYVQISSLAITTSSLVDYTGGSNYYYRLFSVNTAGVSTNVVTISSLGELNYFLEDCLSRLVIDAPSASSLSGSTNGVGDIRVIGASRPQDVSGTTFKSVEWTATYNGAAAAKDFALPKPGRIVIAFDTVNGAPVPSAATGSGQSARAAASPAGAVGVKDLGVYWNNGQRFVKMYGKIDPVTQTISVDSPNLGVYQIRAQARSNGAVFDVSNLSSRVITPNGDGRNDTLIFTYDPGPNNVVPEGRILDMNGAFVADMTQGLVPNTLTWNGTMNGAPAHSGVYMYRITGGGKTFTGTVVVAR